MSGARRPVAPPEGNLTDTIKIDVTLIPDHVRDELAAAGYAFIKRIVQQPGVRERLDARTAARKERQKAATAAQKKGEVSHENRKKLTGAGD